jgi:hypothetical protein
MLLESAATACSCFRERLLTIANAKAIAGFNLQETMRVMTPHFLGYRPNVK